MADDGDRVVVRMYRGVLGDCFLITLWRDGKASVAMIDCGVLQNVQSGDIMVTSLPPEVVESVGAAALRKVEGTKDAVRSIEADILAYLEDKGGKLDLLVITHDHYDHVAGFTLPDDENVLNEPSFKN
jgi:glyoxylase-like metal-dependent hydrolase (beta-lactamase superfamily II)